MNKNDLLQAISQGNKELVEDILKNESDLFLDSSDCILAAKDCQVDIFRILINYGCNTSDLDGDGWSVLHHAVSVGCIEITKILLGDNKLCKINARTMYGKNSALHIAVSKGYEEIVDELLKANAKIDIKNGLKQTPLRIAVDNDKISIVRKLLKVYSDPNIPDKQGETPLTAAIKLNNFRITNEIFKFNPSISLPASILYQVIADGMVEIACLLTYHINDINEKDYEGNAPIILASSKGYKKILRALITKGCDMNVLDSRGWNALHNAAHSGHINVVRELFLNNFKCNTLTTKNENALHLAVSGGHVDIIELLVKVGIDLETKNEEGQTPLQLAVEENQTKCARKLLKLGSNPDVENKYGEKLINHAIRRENLEFVSSVLLPGKEASPIALLTRAVETKQIEIVKFLLVRGSWKDGLKGDDGFKLFKTYIINNFDSEIFKLLLENGLDINITDNMGNTMINYAITYNKPDVLKCLIDVGADVNYHNVDNGFTAMHFAACMNNRDLIDILYNSNADLNAVNFKNETPFMMAVVLKKTESAKKLIDLGVNPLNDPNVVDFIVMAKTVGADEILEILTSAGVESNDKVDVASITDQQKNVLRLVVNRGSLIESDDDIARNIANKNESGWTALHYAALYGYTDLCVRFLNNGADPNWQVDSGDTPLHMAVTVGHIEVIEVLVNYGASIYIINNNGNTPIQWAIQNHRMDSFIKMLDTHVKIEKREKEEIYNDINILHIAANRQNPEVIKSLLDLGVDPNKCNKAGDFVLHNLIKMKSKHIIELLMMHSNVDLEVEQNNNKQTPLMFAIRHGELDIAILLLESKANPNVEDAEGQTPLSCIVRSKNVDFTNKLLTYGAKVTQEHLLLHQAVLDDKIEMVDLLIDKCDVNIFNNAGDTPLLIAARNGNLNIFNRLLEHGASINAINKITKSTVLHEVIESVQDLNVFKGFLNCMTDRDFDINRWIPKKGSPLYMTITTEREKFAMLLIRSGADLAEFQIDENKMVNYLSLAIKNKMFKAANILIWSGMKFSGGFMRNPWTLDHLAGQTVRSLLPRNSIRISIDSLHIPESIKMFLVYDIFYKRHSELDDEVNTLLEIFNTN